MKPRSARSRSRPRRIGRWLLVVVALVTVALVVRGSARRAHRERVAAPADSLAGLDAKTAFRRGVELAHQGRHAAALPYFHHTLALRSHLWQTHLDLGSTLFNTAVETRLQRGRRASMTRSSWERVAATQEALERFASAERLAPGLHERAEVADLRARRLANWGLIWDALLDARAAMKWDPTVRAEDPILRAVAKATTR